jgi:hypothetical protein
MRGFKISSRWTRIVVDDSYLFGNKYAPTIDIIVMMITGRNKKFFLRRNKEIISRIVNCADRNDFYLFKFLDWINMIKEI